jgi:predicted CoA-binding protein
MKCEEMLKILNEYVDGTVDPSLCEEFEKHMAGCNPCQVVVDNIRKTITLYKEGKPYEMPVAFHDRLHAMLRERWKEKHPIPMTDTCEIPGQNADAGEISRLLNRAKTIAVVGLSDNPERDSYRVAAYLQKQGYKIIPVNPNASEILGEKSYASLKDVPGPVDIVNVFRKPDAVPGIVDDAIAIHAGSVWMQSGIAHNEAAKKASAAGMTVVMSRCIMVEHKKVTGAP